MSSGGKNKGTPRQTKPAHRQTAESPGLATRVVLSVVLAFHVFVVFLYPWHNSRTSFTVNDVAQSPLLRWYADPLYLNHGHGFFGPDPGPGFIIKFEVRDEAGTVIKSGKFPDAERIGPRLRYHRFKMLADQIEAPGRGRKEQRLQAYARQLLRQEEDGESATVVEVVHEIVSHDDWLGGRALDDPLLYRTETTATQTRSDVEAADSGALSIEQPIQPEPIMIPQSGGRLP